MLAIVGVVASFTSWFAYSHTLVLLTGGVSLQSLRNPRRSQGIGSSPVCPWPPSIHLYRRRCFLLWNHLSSSQTTAAGNPQCLALVKKNSAYLYCIYFFPSIPTSLFLWKTVFQKWDNPSEKLYIVQEISVKAEINCKSLHKVQTSEKNPQSWCFSAAVGKLLKSGKLLSQRHSSQ